MVPIRVCLSITTFGLAGAQRVALWLAKGLDRRRFAPYFVVHDGSGELAGDLPDDVPVVEVDSYCRRLPRAMSVVRLGGYVRALESHPADVAVGVTQYPSFALAFARRRLRATWRLIACEHSFVSKNLADPEAYPVVFRHVYRYGMRPIYNGSCDAIVMTADEGKDDLQRRFGIYASKIHVIPNPIDIPAVVLAAERTLNDPWLPLEIGGPSTTIPVIVAAGRLAVQKRFDVLLDAFAILRRRTQARLLILGKGALKGELRARADRSGVGTDIRIEDCSPPWQHMARSTVFALSSEWEGFPMVLAEAMALGCRIVSVACPSGPREMLRDGEAGILVRPNDPEALARGLELAIAEPETMAAKSKRAALFAREYAVPTVCDRYGELLERVHREARYS
jgi:glycosyltransferase involved in cell wall biosynthesis